MDKALELVKKNVKVSLTVIFLGIAATFGYGSEGCSTTFAPAPAIVAPAPVPVSPVPAGK